MTAPAESCGPPSEMTELWLGFVLGFLSAGIFTLMQQVELWVRPYSVPQLERMLAMAELREGLSVGTAYLVTAGGEPEWSGVYAGVRGAFASPLSEVLVFVCLDGERREVRDAVTVTVREAPGGRSA